MKKSNKISKNGRIRLMLANGKSVMEVAKAIQKSGISRIKVLAVECQYVRNIIKAERRKAERDAIKAMVIKHKSVREIVDRTGLRFTKVAAFVAHLKLNPGVLTAFANQHGLKIAA